MNDIEKMLFEEVQSETFQKVVSDSFSYVDSLIDQSDLDKISEKESYEDANND